MGHKEGEKKKKKKKALLGCQGDPFISHCSQVEWDPSA